MIFTIDRETMCLFAQAGLKNCDSDADLARHLKVINVRAVGSGYFEIATALDVDMITREIASPPRKVRARRSRNASVTA